MSEYEAGVTAPPFHPWCRTTTVPYFEDNYGERAARGADGETYYVPSDMKYGDWKETFVDSNPAEAAAYKGTRNYAADKTIFDKYKAIYGKDFPNTVE
ncbi:MAG: phage head morphogenesis protein, partial [Oscillospiraceae bacterium]|nr:phage head morphogenesis protein [Oscillospiraceae bacterium]